MVALYGGLLSTLGDQVALQDPETGLVPKDATWKKAELFGNLVADLALRALESGTQFDIDFIVIHKSVIFVPLQNELFRIAAAAGAFKDRRRPLYTEGKPDRSSMLKDAPSPLKELSGQAQLPQATDKDLQTEVDYLELMSKKQITAEIATVPGGDLPGAGQRWDHPLSGSRLPRRDLRANPARAHEEQVPIHLRAGERRTGLHHPQGGMGQRSALAQCQTRALVR